MNRALRGVIAGLGNATLLTAGAFALGQINVAAMAIAAVHAASECASQDAADQPSIEDQVPFVLAGLSLLVVYALAASSYHPITGELAVVWFAGLGLRVAAIRTLGSGFRSTTIPTARWVRRGIYRFLEHPSELGLALCIVAAAGVAGTATAFLCATAALLLAGRRVHTERLQRDRAWGILPRNRHFGSMMRIAIALTALILVGCSDAPSKNNSPSNTPNNETSNSPNNGTSNTPNNGTSNAPNNVPLNNPTADPAVIDLLFVVDNSGSMCQEQTTLRNNFELFVEELADANIDFHVGITTTDMNPDYGLEPVSSPGLLQSTPQPVPGFDRSCHTAVDDSGTAIPGDYQPIRDAIAAAVDCMATPDDTFNEVTNADIECALYASPMGCQIARADCGGGTPCTPESLFPDPSEYRSVPKVLRSQDYTNGDTLDVEALKADFACASFVGTRGYGIEKGLSAAVEALSLQNTGGALGSDGASVAAPNHGLLREDSRFGLVFVTDENDCSHDGTLAEDSACGGDVCEFANRSGEAGPLLAPEQLADDLMANLRASKGVADLSFADVFVASIHGNSRRFGGDVPTDAECGSASYEGIEPTCATNLGVTFSGDRYERFLRAFPADRHFPQPNPSDPDSALTGWMCTGDFRPALSAIGQFFTENTN